MSILDELRRIQESKEKRSQQASDLYLKKTQERAEVVREKLRSGKDIGDNYLPEVRMRQLFNSMVESYFGSNNFHMPSTMDSRSKALWRRVVSTQQRSNKGPEQFLRAQFAYFDKTFGCAPKLHQLTTEAAIERANNFGGSKKDVVSGGIEYKLDKADQFRIAEKTLLQVQRAQGMTREEVYRNLVIPGHLLISPEFLKVDPVFKKVKQEQDGEQ